MRKHLLTTVVFGLGVAARATPARADVGLGRFLGEPTGIDLKVGLGSRSGLDLVLGFTRLSSNADGRDQLFGAPAAIQAPIRKTSSSVSGASVPGGIGDPHGGMDMVSLLSTLMNSRLLAASPGMTRTNGGISDAQVTPDVPAPVPCASTPTRSAYATYCELMSSLPTVTPLPPGWWHPVQRLSMIVV
jgi:hypothetical protein